MEQDSQTEKTEKTEKEEETEICIKAFLSYLKDRKESCRISIGYPIDGVQAKVSVRKQVIRIEETPHCSSPNNLYIQYFVDVKINGFILPSEDFDYLDTIVYTVRTEKIEEIPTILKQILSLKISKDSLRTPEEFYRIRMLRNSLLEMEEKEIEKCCVCYEPTDGYQTPVCDHDICRKCFILLCQHFRKKHRICIHSHGTIFCCPYCRKSTNGLGENIFSPLFCGNL
jgi:hypothetical protein